MTENRRTVKPKILLRIESAHSILNHMVQYASTLDSAFAAVADPTRRGILERLGRRDASITELAEAFQMTLTGMKKHVQVLEDAGLVQTAKVGRVRTCRLGPRQLTAESAWIAKYQQMVEARLDSLGDFLERTKGDQS
jgi:DNA-binding transcriptional ArsR family regulator